MGKTLFSLSVLPVVLLILNGALLGLLVAVLLRRTGSRGSTGLLQPQLIELRERLDRLVATQGEFPRALAEDRAEHATEVASQFGVLSQMVTAQLKATQDTVGERLTNTGRAVADVRERLGELTQATKRLETLGEEVAEVQALLKVPTLRGPLGEVWLEELLRQVFPRSLYRIQYPFSSGERVDAVLRIGDRLVPVDSKFPLEAAQRMWASDGDERDRERRAFRRTVKSRIDEIAGKYIRPDHGTYDFALMYVPAERVYYEAVVADGTMVEEDSVLSYAMERKVIPVSPNTFYAYLVAILHGLRGLRVQDRAQEILSALHSLKLDLDSFQRTHTLLGRHLDNSLKQQAEADRHLSSIMQRFSHVLGLGRSGDGC